MADFPIAAIVTINHGYEIEPLVAAKTEVVVVGRMLG
jgi:hypothetical protein